MFQPIPIPTDFKKQIEKIVGEEINDDLIVLCKDCHAKFHDKEK